jgi:hypothetical protein
MKNKKTPQKDDRSSKTSIELAETESTPRILVFSRSALVLNLLVAIVRLMQGISFLWFVVLGYALFLLIGVEIWYEPPVRKFRWLSCLILLGAVVCFSVFFTFAAAPLRTIAYTRPGDYPASTVIGGIPWNSHFTDLRVAITNPTSDDYHDVDITIKPDQWIHEATVLDNGANCRLFRENGNFVSAATVSKSGNITVTAKPLGNATDAYDNGGNVYSILASEAGYRLNCSKVPSHHTIQVVFAAVVVDQKFIKPPVIPPGGSVMTAVEIAGADSAFDILGPKPSPRQVFLNGKYARGLKPHSINQSIKVEASQ